MLSNLLKDIDTGSEELAQEELKNNTGGSAFVKANGIYKSTIERAYVTETKKGGIQFDIHLTGENSINFRLYPVSNKNGKKITTYTYAGKTMSLQDYKMLKQIVFCATGLGQSLEEIKIEEQDIEFKEYGKKINLTAGMLVDLVGKEIQYGVRQEAEYNYEDGETDKTCYKTDDEGKLRFKLTLFSVYNKDGKTPVEAIKKEDALQVEKDKEFLLGDKGVKMPKLEEAIVTAVPDVEDEDEIIDF